MSAKFLSRAVLICWISSLSVAVAQVRGPADVVVLEQHETSEPLRNIPPLPPQAGQHMKPVYHIPHSLGPAQPDPALQTQAGASAAPATMQNFDGVGNGFSGPVVAQGQVFVTDHQFNPEVERVLCFDEAAGKPLWVHSYPCNYKDMEYGNGPRASPTPSANPERVV